MNEGSKQYASESFHFYDKHGNPAYEVPNKSKGGMRPTTMRDCRALGLYPSVTTITRCADKAGLRRYFDYQMYLAAFTTPRTPEMTDDQHFEACLAWAKEHSKAAADLGTKIHGAIERQLLGQSVEPEFQPIVAQTMNALAGANIPLGSHKAEKSFASPLGYGGKVDLHGPTYVVDFKTKATLAKCEAYDEYGMQLEAYRIGLGLPEDSRLLNVLIATDGTGIKVHEWKPEERERHRKMFFSLLEYWQQLNKYQPKI